MYRTPLAGSSASGGSGIGRGSTRHPIKRCRLISHRLHLPPEQPRHLLQLQEGCGKPRILDQKPKHALHLFPPRTMGRATRDHRLHLLTCLCPQGDVGVSSSVGA